MRGYAECEVFSKQELQLWRGASAIVATLPWGEYGELLGPGGEPLRCHELARYVGEVLDLQVQDGSYGFVEHTWLWTSPKKTDREDPWALPNVLDVYVPGRLPQVQLIHPTATLLFPYRLGQPRADIREGVLTLLRSERRAAR